MEEKRQWIMFKGGDPVAVTDDLRRWDGLTFSGKDEVVEVCRPERIEQAQREAWDACMEAATGDYDPDCGPFVTFDTEFDDWLKERKS